jgi:hypothetical protein
MPLHRAIRRFHKCAPPKKIRLEISETVYDLLRVLDERENVEEVIHQLIDHAQQGVYRPGSWERAWLMLVFGDQWTQLLESGDPYGRPNGTMFDKPIHAAPRKKPQKLKAQGTT